MTKYLPEGLQLRYVSDFKNVRNRNYKQLSNFESGPGFLFSLLATIITDPKHQSPVESCKKSTFY